MAVDRGLVRRALVGALAAGVTASLVATVAVQGGYALADGACERIDGEPPRFCLPVLSFGLVLLVIAVAPLVFGLLLATLGRRRPVLTMLGHALLHHTLWGLAFATQQSVVETDGAAGEVVTYIAAAILSGAATCAYIGRPERVPSPTGQPASSSG